MCSKSESFLNVDSQPATAKFTGWRTIILQQAVFSLVLRVRTSQSSRTQTQLVVGLILIFQMVNPGRRNETQLIEVGNLFFPSVIETTVFICSLKQLLFDILFPFLRLFNEHHWSEQHLKRDWERFYSFPKIWNIQNSEYSTCNLKPF